jgi:hypothetical protein
MEDARIVRQAKLGTRFLEAQAVQIAQELDSIAAFAALAAPEPAKTVFALSGEDGEPIFAAAPGAWSAEFAAGFRFDRETVFTVQGSNIF